MVAPIQVVGDSFADLKPQMLADIARADFVAIDTEMTGLATSSEWSNVRNDTISSRYCRVRNAAQLMAITQFGIACFWWEEDASQSRGGRWIARSYSTFLFPRGRNVRTVFESQAFEFLRDNAFDFGKWVRGVTFSSRFDVERAVFSGRMSKRCHNDRPRELISLDRPDIIDRIAKTASALLTWVRWVRDGRGRSPTAAVDAASAASSSSSSSGAATADADAEREEDESMTAESVPAIEEATGEARFRVTTDEAAACPALVLWPMNGFERKVAHDTVAACFPGLILIERTEDMDATLRPGQKRLRALLLEDTHPDGAAVVESVASALAAGDSTAWPASSTTSRASVRAFRDAALSQAVDEAEASARSAAGFTEVMEAVIARKCPLVVHNGLLDLMHTVNTFLRPLPADAKDFVSVLRAAFPTIFDTKCLVMSVPQLGNDFESSSLEAAFETTRASTFANVEIRAPDALPITEAEELSADTVATSAASAAAEPVSRTTTAESAPAVAHDAGYDAWMTGVVFARTMDALGVKPEVLRALREAAPPSSDEIERGMRTVQDLWSSHRDAIRVAREARAAARVARSIGSAGAPLASPAEASPAVTTDSATPTPAAAAPTTPSVSESGVASDPYRRIDPPAITPPSSAEECIAQLGNTLNMMDMTAARSWRLEIGIDEAAHRSRFDPRDKPADEAGELAHLGPKATTIRMSGLNRSLRTEDIADVVSEAIGDKVAAWAVTWVDNNSCFIALPSIDAVRRALDACPIDSSPHDAADLESMSPTLAEVARERAAYRQTSLARGESPPPPGVDPDGDADPWFSQGVWRDAFLPRLENFFVETYAAYIQRNRRVFGHGCNWEFDGLPRDLLRSRTRGALPRGSKRGRGDADEADGVEDDGVRERPDSS